ncbi:MAG TPA: ornithine carbamoyltransferase [Fimbriimonadaceae bacterium]|nr:ornithine carbamoyltransferase [Fimbriimonadaceae bacterium]
MHAPKMDYNEPYAAGLTSGPTPTHVLASTDLSGQQLRKILDTAKSLKDHWHYNPAPIVPHENRLLAMIFEKQSLRTRVSFDNGWHELGGHSVYLTKADIDMGKRESVADTAQVLSRWASLIVARLNEHAVIQELAKYSSVPVVNALTDLEHPCQALADLQTIEEVFGDKKLKIAWVGDGNNVANSLSITAARLGHQVVICTPPGYEADDYAYKEPGVESVYLPQVAVKDADVVVTDTWVSMGQEAEAAERLPRFAKYQVNEDLMKIAKPSAIFMHCLPAHRGEEVTPGVIDGPQSVVFQEAENRMHAQKALMKLLLEKSL